jgi:hypothetical protein
MTQGYVTIATKSADDMQIKQAVALASSLKLIDPDREFCLIVDSFSVVPEKYENSFDSIIELPYGNYDPTEDIAINLWQVYSCSPYEQTMYFDRHILVTMPLDDIWDSVTLHDYIFTPQTVNYRGESTASTEQFYVHNKNNLPTYYTDVFYFGKNEKSQQFFKMLDVVLKEFRRVYAQFVTESRPKYFDLNLLINITIKLLGEENSIHGTIPYTLLRLDNITLDDEDLPLDWVDYMSYWISNGVIKVSNHRVNGIICYSSDQFLDTEILEEYRQRVRDININID